MVTITVSNYYGDLYSKALRNGSISFLFEIDGDNTILKIKAEDWQKANRLIDIARKSAQ